MEYQAECLPISSIRKGDKILLLELEIHRDQKLYVINVATPTYLAQLHEYNAAVPEKLRLSENIYPLNPIESAEQACKDLSSLPLETLKPYLEPIETL